MCLWPVVVAWPQPTQAPTLGFLLTCPAVGWVRESEGQRLGKSVGCDKDHSLSEGRGKKPSETMMQRQSLTSSHQPVSMQQLCPSPPCQITAEHKMVWDFCLVSLGQQSKEAQVPPPDKTSLIDSLIGSTHSPKGLKFQSFIWLFLNP